MMFSENTEAVVTPQWRWAGAALFAALAVFVASLVVTQPAMADDPPLLPAQVSVEFGSEQGSLLHTERFNNFHTTSVYPAQRPIDVDYLNSLGMHGSVYRVWLNSPNEPDVPPCLEDIDSPQAADKPCTLNPPFDTYLTDAENVSQVLMGNLRLNGIPGFMSEGGPEAARPLIERILLAIKEAHPKLTYVEAWNEPDEPRTTIVPSQVYEYYVPVYQAVNNINAALENEPGYVPIKVGGPTLYYFHQEWLETFLDDYVADENPGKRLDFISYHAYLGFENGVRHFYKDDPSLVAGQREKLDEMLQERGLDTNIPTYITESGIYPGPMCDECLSTDYARTAAGIASLHYWFQNQPNTYPFNWLTRQRAGGLKDQFVTKDSTGPYLNARFQQIWPTLDPIPSNTFTPFGNMLYMKSMMKDTRVSATSDSLHDGIGVYADASKDETGASLMVWNYQGCPGVPSGNPPTNPNCPTTAYRTTIDASNLPADLANRLVDVKMFRIDQNTSNYFGDSTSADLQQVESKTVRTGTSYLDSVDLQPNAIYLILLEPATPPSKDACKASGGRDCAPRPDNPSRTREPASAG